jgi:hypothetical protein
MLVLSFSGGSSSYAAVIRWYLRPNVLPNPDKPEPIGANQKDVSRKAAKEILRLVLIPMILLFFASLASLREKKIFTSLAGI